MAEDTKGIFVSYRRGDTAGYAGWLAQELQEHFGKQMVFYAINSIDPGVDFVEAIERAIRSSEVLLAVIGGNWATATDDTGHKRLQDPEDFVRIEIVTALGRDVRVIPVLVQDASMPRARELPSDLAPLSRLNAFELHEDRWERDVRQLISRLEQMVGDGWQRKQPTGDKEASEVAARNIRETISDFLEFLQQRRIWREGEGHREIADPEKMRDSVEAIRTNLTNTINIVRRENYAHPELLTDIQDACLTLLDHLDRNLRRQKREPDFGDEEFFDEVYPRLGDFQPVVEERGLQLCKDQNLCGETGPCRGFC
jgi:hypothetical protein